MGSAASHMSTMGDAFLFDLHMQADFTQHQLNDFAAVQSQQQSVAMANAAATGAALGGGGANGRVLSPEQSALRNFTQLVVNVLAYVGPFAFIVAGVLYGVNFTTNFLDQVTLFAILYVGLLCMYYFVVSFVQPMKAYIGTAKIFFLGSLFSGLVGGVLSFAVYTPPSDKTSNLVLEEKLELGKKARSDACATISGDTLEQILQSYISIADARQTPCLPLELSNESVLAGFAIVPTAVCAKCEGDVERRSKIKPIPEGRMHLYKTLPRMQDRVVFEYTTQNIEEYVKHIRSEEDRIRKSGGAHVELVSVSSERLLGDIDVQRLQGMGVKHENLGLGKAAMDIFIGAGILEYASTRSLGYFAALLRPAKSSYGPRT
jgi:hypothetical protein